MSSEISHVTLKCPNCGRLVYYAERIMCMNRQWHKSCLRCAKCNKIVDATRVSCIEGKPYCTRPCYNNMYFTKGYNRVHYK